MARKSTTVETVEAPKAPKRVSASYVVGEMTEAVAKAKAGLDAKVADFAEKIGGGGDLCFLLGSGTAALADEQQAVAIAGRVVGILAGDNDAACVSECIIKADFAARLAVVRGMKKDAIAEAMRNATRLPGSQSTDAIYSVFMTIRDDKNVRFWAGAHLSMSYVHYLIQRLSDAADDGTLDIDLA